MKLDPASRKGMTLIELIVVVAIIAILIGLTLPAVLVARATASRMQCSNNLRQIGLGLSNYHSALGQLPSGVRLGSDEPLPSLTWLARILPFVEQDALWKETTAAFAITKQVTSTPHPIATVVRLYGCPSDGRVGTAMVTRGKFPVALTSYLGVSGKNGGSKDGILYNNSTIRFTDIIDGTSNTLMVGERPPSKDLWYGWWYAGIGTGNGTADMVLGVREPSPVPDAYIPDCGGLPLHFGPGRLDNMCDAFHYWSQHPGGANFLYADGSVRFLPYSADSVMPALASRAGGEVFDLP